MYGFSSRNEKYPIIAHSLMAMAFYLAIGVGILLKDS